MANKKNYSSLSIALAIAAGSMAPQVGAVDLGPVQIDGFIRHQMSMNLEDPIGPAGEIDGEGDLSMNRTTLQLEWSADLPKDILFKGVARKSWETGTDYLDRLDAAGAFGSESAREYYEKSEIREAYLEIPVGDRVLLSLGKQQVAWGETDFFQALDMVHGFDYTWRSFLEPANEDLRKPLIMANALIDIPEADGQLQLLYRPGWDNDRQIGNSYDIEGGRWANTPWKTVFFPAADPYAYDHPEGDADDATYGVRWNGQWGDYGYSLAYLHTHNPDPVMNANPAFGGSAYKGVYTSDPATTIGEVIFPMIDVLGFTLNGYSEAGDFVWSTEFAYIKDAPFNVSSVPGNPGALCSPFVALPHGFCGIQESDVLRTMFRIDKNLAFTQDLLGTEKPAFFSTQLFNTWLLDHEEGMKLLVGQPENRKEHSTLLTFILGTSYMNGRLTPELVTGFDLTYGGGFAVPSVTYAPGNHWRFKIEADLFWADGNMENGGDVSQSDASLFGWFEGNDQLAATVTYQF
ncbi:DUF1302 family protein [uncultured Neptuniibacter sp.]|uniref:DUF1302 family protein n=1 Tax=uncultured Neptuniibacter sp. TaxID=502143 RepID=UPI002604B092|nr:DUF1302 family protein [uncultured Neptuniibacter sp.]